MNYSFKAFIEERYMDVLVSAAEAFVEHEGRCSIDVSVCHVTIGDIDYAPLKRGSDFVRFPVVLRVSTLSTEDSISYHRDIYIRSTLSGSFSEEFSDMEITCQSASADCRGRWVAECLLVANPNEGRWKM